MASNCQLCNDTSESVELFRPQGLYLKPFVKVNVCVQLPQLKEPGKSISNWEVMEKVKHMVRPHQFLSIKIIKSTLEFIRLEGETETKALVKTLVQRLDGKTIKLSGFPDILKVKAAEAKINFPTKHDWDSYFRDAKNMNEMKAGERPDTIYFKDLPTKWFASSSKNKDKDKPSELVLKSVFGVFGEIRCVDIPMLDPYRQEIMSTKGGSIQTFSFGQGLTFEAFVQFKEYISFVKAMDSLRGMKLLYMPDHEDKAFTANIRVDFDKTKHLSDKAIRKRRVERFKLDQLEKEREEKVRLEREEKERKDEEEKEKKLQAIQLKERKRQERIQKKEERQKSREEKRRLKKLQKQKEEDERAYQLMVQKEERRLMIAQRKLESMRLLSELFNRVKKIKVQEDLEKEERELEEQRKRQLALTAKRKYDEKMKKIEAKKRRKEELVKHEDELRNKILKNWKEKEEKKEEELRENLRQKLADKKKKLKSAVVLKH